MVKDTIQTITKPEKEKIIMTVECPLPYIFWFEDDRDVSKDPVSVLQEQYNFTVGAELGLIRHERNQPFDLVLLDIMIYPNGEDDDDQEVENIQYDGISWRSVGVEFLRDIRAGKYERSGFSRDVPVVAVTAIIEYPIIQEIEKLGISERIRKVFTIDQLKLAIEKTLKTAKDDNLA
jgi:CheY-like chemotaxis protein